MKRTVMKLFALLMVISIIITPVSAHPVSQVNTPLERSIPDPGMTSPYREEVPAEIQELFANGLTPQEFVQIAGYVPNSLKDIVQGEALMIIELEDAPLAVRYIEQKETGRIMTNRSMQNYKGQIESAQQQLEAKLSPLNITVISNYTTVFNGMQVLLPLSQLNAVRALPGVKALHRAPLYEPSLAVSVDLIGALDVWGDLDNTGDGVTIAIIDTGIDYTHATFGGSGDPADYATNNPDLIEDGTFPTIKVMGGYDFAGTTYNANSQPIPVPDEDPLDENGHGTHVASTAAGSGGGLVSKGVAPDASLMALKVFGSSGSTALVIDALDYATQSFLENGYPQVINMSLGSSFGTNDPNNPSVLGTNNAIAAGIVVVASAGNSGNVQYITGSPAASDGAISVAASTTGYLSLPIITLLETSQEFMYFPAGFDNGTGRFIEELEAPLGYVGNLPGSNGNNQLCNITGLAPDALQGKIALIQRGTCNFSVKVNYAAELGAVGAIIYNNAPGGMSMGGVPVSIPAAFIQMADGVTLTAADGKTILVGPEDEVQLFPDPTTPADMIATFSSRGPRGYDSFLKPEITAPGANIYAARMGGGTTGVSMSGTSMAAPHVAGTAALMLAAQPDLTPEQVKAILMNTVEPLADSTPIPRSGSGRVNAYRAVSAEEYAIGDEALVSLSWGVISSVQDSLSLTKELSITNNRGSDLVMDISWNFQDGSRTAGAALAVPAQFSIPDGQTSVMDVILNLDFTQIPSILSTLEEYYGWVTLTPQDGDTTPLKVPFYFQPRPYTTLEMDTSSSLIQDPENDIVEIDLSHSGPITSNLEILTALIYNETPNPSVHGSADVRLFGMDYFIDPAYGDLVYVGINTWDKWHVPQPVIAEFDLYLDVDQDGVWDLVNFNAPIGTLTGAATSNAWIVVQYDLTSGMLDLGSPYYIYTDYNSGTMGWILPADWQYMSGSTFDYLLVSYDAFGTEISSPPGSFDYLKSPFGWTISSNPGPENRTATAQVWIQDEEGYSYADPLGVMLVDWMGSPSGGGQAYFQAITIPVPPIASFTISSQEVEVGTEVQFTNTTVGTEPLTYQWDFGDGTDISAVENPAHTYTISGLYTVTLTAENVAGVDTFEETILVTPRLPETDLSVAISISPVPVKVGVETSFTAVVSNAGPDDATGVVVSGLMPDTIEFIEGENCFLDEENLLTCDLGTIAAGESKTAVVALKFTAAGSFDVEVNVVGIETDLNLANNAYKVVIEVGEVVTEIVYKLFMPLVSQKP